MNSLIRMFGKILRVLVRKNRKKEKRQKLDEKMLEVVDECLNTMAKNCYSMNVIEGVPTPLDTHMGGLPYMPKNVKWPLNKSGYELPFLIQINFEGVELENFPNKGLLQVFYDDEREECEIRFYEELDNDYQDESCLPKWHYEEGYTSGIPLKIELKKTKEVIPYSNEYEEGFRKIFEKHYGEYDRGKYDKELSLISSELSKYSNRGNIGGWAISAQGYFDDVKGPILPNGNEIFFFIDSMLYYPKICFGDCGYFWAEINPKDLKEKNFQKIIVKTDCY